MGFLRAINGQVIQIGFVDFRSISNTTARQGPTLLWAVSVALLSWHPSLQPLCGKETRLAVSLQGGRRPSLFLPNGQGTCLQAQQGGCSLSSLGLRFPPWGCWGGSQQVLCKFPKQAAAFWRWRKRPDPDIVQAQHLLGVKGKAVVHFKRNKW